MPPVLVYSVDFANGNLHPTVDLNGWGDMVFGGSTTGALEREPVADGLVMTATRPSTAQGGLFNGVYVVFPPPPRTHPAGNLTPPTLPRATRLQLHVEFDLPDGTPEPTSPANQIWAVALRVKLGDEKDRQNDQMINVTCQFNKDGVRLADPDRAQDAASNSPANLDSPLDYAKYSVGFLVPPTQFNLDFAYSGIQAGPVPPHPPPRIAGDNLGYAVGCGFLEMISGWQWWFGKSPLNKYDRRVFSSTKLSTPLDAGIGALGVSVGSINYVGRMTARLKRFSVSSWDLDTGNQVNPD